MSNLEDAKKYHYDKLTPEMIDKVFTETFKNEPPIGKLSSGLYHIGGFCYTNERGYIEFEKELSKQIEK